MRHSRNSDARASAKRIRQGLWLGGASAFALAIAQPAVAQTATDEDATQVDEIVVTGIRAALQQAIAQKRNADQIVDVITAEDIGKLPDENIAESLQRVTGIQIQQNRGEGNGYQIRGLTQNLTLINGHSVVNPDNTRQVDLFNYPAELFSAIEVFKSPTAELVEGGLGGTVNLRTYRPFDFSEPRLAGSVQAIYSSLAEEWTGRATGLVSRTFADDTVGVLLSATYSRRQLIQDRFTATGWAQVNGAIDADRNGVNDANVRRPQELQFIRDNEERERLGLNAQLQWRPVEGLELHADLTYTELNSDSTRGFLSFVGNNDETGNGQVIERLSDGSTSILAGEFANVLILQDGTNQPIDRYVLTGALGFKWTGDRLRLSGELAYSEAEMNDKTLVVQLQRTGNTIFYDFTRGTDIPDVSVRAGGALTDPAGYNYRVLSMLDIVEPSDGLEGRFDAEYELGGGFFESVQAGVRFTDKFIDRQRGFSRVQETFATGTRPPANQFPQLLTPFSPGNFLADASGNFPREFLVTATPFDANDEIRALFGVPDTALDRLGSFSVKETTSAIYGQANFSSFIGDRPISGNAGVRVVRTESESTGVTAGTVGGVTTFTPVTIANDYTDVLPSLNLRLELTEDWIVRFSAARVIARPEIDDLRAGTQLGFSANNTATRGNPLLDPFRANQIDATLEWYFAPGGLLALAGFYKDVESFIQPSFTEDVVIPGAPPNQVFDLTQPANGEGGSIRGFEIGYQQTFDFLPSPWDGFGVNANYTFVDSEQPTLDPVTGGNLPLALLSENSYNIVAFYEKYGFGARLAYNWRDRYFTSISRGSAEFVEDRGQLDASFSYDITPDIAVTLEAINLLETPDRGYSQFENRRNLYSINDRRVFIGLRGSF